MFKLRTIDIISYFFTRLRIIPRAFLLAYCILLHFTVMYVIGIPDITTAQTIFLSVITTIATPITKFYIDSGKNLYDRYDDLNHKSRLVKNIDRVGYVFEKLRLIPILFVLQYVVGLGLLLYWGFGLGELMTKSQASFISVYAGNAAMMFGFLVTTESLNKDIEEKYASLNKEHKERIDATKESDKVCKNGE